MVNSAAVKSARVAAGLTQKQMAKEMNISENSYCRKENGQVAFTVPEVIDFCKAARIEDPVRKAQIFLQ